MAKRTAAAAVAPTIKLDDLEQAWTGDIFVAVGLLAGARALISGPIEEETDEFDKLLNADHCLEAVNEKLHALVERIEIDLRPFIDASAERA